MHFVHFKDAYLNDDGSLNATLSNGQNDVAAVIGVFLEVKYHRIKCCSAKAKANPQRGDRL